MKTFVLKWKGWWLLRSPMTDVPELGAKSAVYAVMGAKLKKVGNAVGSSGRELVMFGVHKADQPLKQHLEGLSKTALGVFIHKRCEEIRKRPIVYLAALPDDIGLSDLGAIHSLLYGSVPFAPKHHAMPEPYEGPQIILRNNGKNPGLEVEVGGGEREIINASADDTRDPVADEAMSKVIQAEAAITRIMTIDEMDPRGVATEKVDKPGHIATERVEKPPRLVETARLDKDDIPHGIETERVAKPSNLDNNTEFVPRPDQAERSGDEDAETDEGPTILDEAGHEA